MLSVQDRVLRCAESRLLVLASYKEQVDKLNLVEVANHNELQNI